MCMEVLESIEVLVGMCIHCIEVIMSMCMHRIEVLVGIMRSHACTCPLVPSCMHIHPTSIPVKSISSPQYLSLLLHGGFDGAYQVVEDSDPVLHVLVAVYLHVECSVWRHNLKQVLSARHSTATKQHSEMMGPVVQYKDQKY